jgi:hypothetical protein
MIKSEMKNTDNSAPTLREVIASSPKPLLVFAHTAIQLNIFRGSYVLGFTHVLRMNACTNPIIGRQRDRPVFLLPGWEQGERPSRVVEIRHHLDWWLKTGGTVREVEEAEVNPKL